MKKSGKIVLTAIIGTLVLAGAVLAWALLTGRDGVEGDLVFVNGSGIAVGSVGIDEMGADGGIISSTVGQNADNSVMGRGASIGFEVERGYPLELTAYSAIGGHGALASLTISEAPAGERWYVVARDDGAGGVTLELTGQRPDELK